MRGVVLVLASTMAVVTSHRSRGTLTSEMCL